MKNIFSTVNPATTFWTLVCNFRVNCFVLAGLQQKCAVLGLFFKLASVAAGVDRLKTAFNQKNKRKL